MNAERFTLVKFWKEKQLLLLIPLLTLLVLRSLGFDGLYGQDSYEYLRYTHRLADFLAGGDYPGDLVWPKGYLFLTTLFSFFLTASLGGQLISLLCFYGVIYYTAEIISELYGKHEARIPYLVLALVMSPYLLRLSNVMMADTLAMCCLIACASYTLKFKRSEQQRHLVWATFFGFYGVFSRYAVIIPVSPLLVWLLVLSLRKPHWKQLLVLLIPGVLLLLHFYLEGRGSDFLGHHFVAHWDVRNLLKSSFVTEPDLQIPDVNYPLPNFLYYTLGFLHPGFFSLFPLLLLLGMRRLRSFLASYPLPFAISILVYSLFLAGITFQGNRYLALTYPFIVVLFYPFFEQIIGGMKSWRTTLWSALMLLQLALFVRAMLPSYEMNALERHIAKELEDYQGETLYSFELDIALQGRDLSFTYESLWEKEYKHFQEGALVLFNEDRIAAQFAGKNPMNNWQKLKQDYSLKELKRLNNGWKLYRIES
jgi:hypothetical protein